MTRALIVDDNATNRKLLGDLLRLEGLEVAEATSSEEAFDLLDVRAYDILVLDIQLPGMDGLTATRRLRNDERHFRLPILAVTAQAMRGDEERILSAGCDGYLSKPIDYKRFLAEVRRLLERDA